MSLTALSYDVQTVTFTFLDKRDMIGCSILNRSWKVLALGAATRVYQCRYQTVINQIRSVLLDNFHSVEIQRLVAINFESFQSITSFPNLELRSKEVYEMIHKALFDPTEPNRKIIYVVNLDTQLEEIATSKGFFVRKRRKEVNRNIRYGNLTNLLTILFENFHRIGRIEEALMVARLIPTEKGHSSVRGPQTKKSDCLKAICLSLIQRHNITRAQELMEAIPNHSRMQQVCFEIIKYWIQKKDFEQAYAIAHFLEHEDPVFSEGVINRKYIAFEELAKAYYIDKQYERAINLKALIPDNDPDGCKNRLNKEFSSNKCVIA